MAEHDLFAVSADWVMPIEAPPINNGWVVIDSGIVEFVGSQLPAMFHSAKRYSLNDYAILPGLINSHCHLEFSDLQQPILAGDSFANWIGNLLAHRRLQSNCLDQKASTRRAAIASGIRESYAAGVRWIVDMTTQPWENEWIEMAVADMLSDLCPAFVPHAPIITQPCVEILDIAKSRLAETLAFACKQLGAPESPLIGEMGYAPHAPYTTSWMATELCVELSNANQRLVTMHLGESADEIAWLEHQQGGFRDLLGPVLGDDYFKGLGQISKHFELLTQAPKSLIAHGNYLSERNIKQLAERSQTMAIVHCPRTHRHFGHRHFGHRHEDSQQYPLSERQSLGVRHLLGTDSRASNPDLNLWSEAKQVRADHPSIASESILKMITLDAAEFLGIDERYGAIRKGAPALLTAIKLASDCPPSERSNGLERAYDIVLNPATESAPLELVLSGIAGPVVVDSRSYCENPGN